MKTSKLKMGLLLGATICVGFSSCKKDDDAVVQPVANFTAVVDGPTKTATFTNTSTNAEVYSWDFGDGSTISSEASPVHVYTTGGDFIVSLTAAGVAGSTASVKTETVSIPVPKNYVTGGEFETADAASWTVMTTGQKDGDGNVTNVKYAFGHTAYKPTLGTGGSLYIYPNNDAPANPKEEGSIFYQSLGAMEAGEYQISFVLKHGGDSPDVDDDMQNEWVEFVINTVQPTENDGYNFDRVTGWVFSGWTGVTVPANDGLMPYFIIDTNKADADGKFSIAETGTYYLAIKIGKGAGTFGEGIAFDKLVINKL